jgi:hypothetical protein
MRFHIFKIFNGLLLYNGGQKAGGCLSYLEVSIYKARARIFSGLSLKFWSCHGPTAFCGFEESSICVDDETWGQATKVSVGLARARPISVDNAAY